MVRLSGDLGWRADGISRARAAGGVELEIYRRPGFGNGTGVRRSQAGGAGGGTYIGYSDSFDHYCKRDPEPPPER